METPREGEARIENEKVNWGCQRQNERQQRRRLKMMGESGRKEEGRRVNAEPGKKFHQGEFGKGRKKNRS